MRTFPGSVKFLTTLRNATWPPEGYARKNYALILAWLTSNASTLQTVSLGRVIVGILYTRPGPLPPQTAAGSLSKLEKPRPLSWHKDNRRPFKYSRGGDPASNRVAANAKRFTHDRGKA